MSTLSTRESAPFGEFNPIDTVEEVLSSNNWTFSRLGEDDLAVRVCGHGGEYTLSFHWDEDKSALEFVCRYDMPVAEVNFAAAIKAVLATDERLWIGHFNLPSDTMIPVFRYTSLFQGIAPANGCEQIDSMVRLALEQCEIHYPLFALLASDTPISDQDISLALSDSMGQS